MVGVIEVMMKREEVEIKRTQRRLSTGRMGHCCEGE